MTLRNDLGHRARLHPGGNSLFQEYQRWQTKVEKYQKKERTGQNIVKLNEVIHCFILISSRKVIVLALTQ